MTEKYEDGGGRTPGGRGSNERQAVLLVYILYLVGLGTGLATIIGLIIAHLKWGVAPGKWDGHYRFQIRTFWLGLLFSLAGYVVFVTMIGIPVAIIMWIWVWIWTAIRTIKGLLRALDDETMDDPATLWW